MFRFAQAYSKVGVTWMWSPKDSQNLPSCGHGKEQLVANLVAGCGQHYFVLCKISSETDKSP